MVCSPDNFYTNTNSRLKAVQGRNRKSYICKYKSHEPKIFQNNYFKKYGDTSPCLIEKYKRFKNFQLTTKAFFFFCRYGWIHDKNILMVLLFAWHQVHCGMVSANQACCSKSLHESIYHFRVCARITKLMHLEWFFLVMLILNSQSYSSFSIIV